MKDRASAGPAWLAAAVPVSTKMPVPMMPPMPSSVSCVAVSARRSSLPEASCACSSSIDLVASSCCAMEPPILREDSTQAAWESEPARRAIAACSAYASRSSAGTCGRQQLQQRRVHLRRAGDDVSRLAVLSAGERADAPAGLLDEQRPRGGVPGLRARSPRTHRRARRRHRPDPAPPRPGGARRRPARLTARSIAR